MRCVYTVLYTNLSSYDGNPTDSDKRKKLLELCIDSFKKTNPNLTIIYDIVSTPFDNTASMYYDKMCRIKDLNIEYDVLWVDSDTICLTDISEIFENETSGTFWGYWDALNCINGGVILYKKNYLYSNFDKFSKDWIKLLYEKGSSFRGPDEQIPITNLILSQLDNVSKSKYSIHELEEEMLNKKLLFSQNYNNNIFGIHHFKDLSIYNECSSIFNKSILHLNASMGIDVCIDIAKLLIDNFLNVVNDKNKLLKITTKLNCNFYNLKIDFIEKENKLLIENNTIGYFSIYVTEDSNVTIDRSTHYYLHPNRYIVVNKPNNNEHLINIYIKNILNGNVYKHLI